MLRRMTQPSFARRLFASLAAAIITSAVASASTVLAVYFVVVVTGVSATFLSIGHDFIFSGLVLVVVVAAAALLGGLGSRPRAIGTAVVAAILAPYFGVVI